MRQRDLNTVALFVGVQSRAVTVEVLCLSPINYSTSKGFENIVCLPY